MQKIFYFYVHQEYLIAEECYADEWGWWSTNVGLSVVKVGKLKCYCNALVYFQSGALSCQTCMKMTNELSIEPFILRTFSGDEHQDGNYWQLIQWNFSLPLVALVDDLLSERDTCQQRYRRKVLCEWRTWVNVEAVKKRSIQEIT